MGEPITIDISSSSDGILESDSEDDAEIAASSSATRRLPDWASTSSVNTAPRGNGGNLQKVSSPMRVTCNDAGLRSSNSHTGLYGSEYQNHSMVQSDMRTLPSSFLPSASHTKPNHFRDVGRSNQINGDGRSYLLTGPSLLNGKNHGKEDITMREQNDVNVMDKSGNRVLPPWMRPSPVSFGHQTSATDALDPFRAGDDKMAGPDERSVFQAVVQDLNQPKQEVDMPDGLLSVPLLRHQKIALAWMRQKEARPFCVGGILADDQGLGKTVSMIALIQMHKHSERKSKSEDEDIHKTEALNLDEDDDNGIVDLDDVKMIEDSNHYNSSRKVSSSYQASHKQRAAAGTLVVCPATVLRQWARELKDKVTKEAKLEVLVYHGSNRTKDPSELSKYDVVLTTYAIVANEVPKQPLVDEDGLPAEVSPDKKRKNPSSSRKKGKKGRKGTDNCFSDGDSGPLARVSWLRVVLDEAQTIKNHRTQAARACWGLRAKRRWCLSGTPIQNTVDELFSYFRFLKYDPYSSYRAFCEGIKGPISRDSQYGYQKLQAVLKTVMLRRTKGTLIDKEPIISLPPKSVKMKSVNFTMEERKFYAKLEAESRSQFKAYARAGTLRQNYANILLMLLRLRQACDHPLLAWGFGSNSIRTTSSVQNLKRFPKDMLRYLLNRFEGSLICQLCEDPPEDAVVAMCGHVFCYQCVLDHLDGDDITCPASRCKGQLGSDVVFSEATLRSWLSDGSESSLTEGDQHDGSLSVLSNDFCSSKIKAALEILQSLVKSSTSCLDSAPSEGPQKAIVFSQWTRMLDLMETSLRQSQFQYRRLDGTMTLAARDRAVSEFSSDPEVTVMLMSLKAGNLGLNMVAACHVILLDLWWNPTTEDQAVDRAHRIGQTRPVTVSRVTIKDTVEDRILALQEEKRKMVASAFGEENGGIPASRLNVHDLKFLFTGVR